jgi:hypothetical protein
LGLDEQAANTAMPATQRTTRKAKLEEHSTLLFFIIYISH